MLWLVYKLAEELCASSSVGNNNKMSPVGLFVVLLVAATPCHSIVR
jgi:hypothetical protein